MTWLRTAPTTTLLERKRGASEAGKYRVIEDAVYFLDVVKASSRCASHRREFGLPNRAEYKGAMVWARPGIK